MNDRPPSRGATFAAPSDGPGEDDVVGEGQRVLSEQARIVRNQQDHAARILRAMLAVGGVTATAASVLVTVLLSVGPPSSSTWIPASVAEPFYACLGGATESVGGPIVAGSFPVGCGRLAPGLLTTAIGVFLVLVLVPDRVFRAIGAALVVLAPGDNDRHGLANALRSGGKLGWRSVLRPSVGKPKDRSGDGGESDDSRGGSEDERPGGRTPDYFDVGPSPDVLEALVTDAHRAGIGTPTLVEYQSRCIRNNSSIVRANRWTLDELYRNLLHALYSLVLGGSGIVVGGLLVLAGVKF